jgi:hypothetical protein
MEGKMSYFFIIFLMIVCFMLAGTSVYLAKTNTIVINNTIIKEKQCFPTELYLNITQVGEPVIKYVNVSVDKNCRSNLLQCYYDGQKMYERYSNCLQENNTLHIQNITNQMYQLNKTLISCQGKLKNISSYAR